MVTRDIKSIDELDALANALLLAAARAMPAATRPMLEEAKRRIPVKSGKLRAHLRDRVEKSTSSVTGVIEVADSGPGGQAHAAVFVEYGHHQRTDKGPRWVPPEPFMRPAFLTTQEQAVQAFAAELAAQLQEKR